MSERLGTSAQYNNCLIIFAIHLQLQSTTITLEVTTSFALLSLGLSTSHNLLVTFIDISYLKSIAGESLQEKGLQHQWSTTKFLKNESNGSE